MIGLVLEQVIGPDRADDEREGGGARTSGVFV